MRAASGNDHECMRLISVRHRNAGKGRNRDSTGNSRDNLERNSRVGQSLRFLAAAAEYERVSTFEAAHILAFARLLNHEPLDVLLLQIFLTGFFADADDFSSVFGFFEQVKVDQTIVKHHVGFAKTSESAHSD
jgi:hypothetical protein